jgi:trk system potassium uptake protein TrkH
MKVRTVGWLIGVVWTGLGAVLLVPLVLALALGEPWRPFAVAIAAAVAGGAALLVGLRGAERALDHRTAFLAVTAIWLCVCALGAVPYAWYPVPDMQLIDALFESVSGFTTTGSTVLTGLETLPRSLLLWRAITQWLGGMGIVIFGVAILPLLGIGGMQLYKAEAPGPTKDQITPRIAETAKLLWILYLSLTIVAAVLLFTSGMDGFEAICHALTSVSTAGFSTRDASLGAFDSSAIHWVMILVMLAGGTSFPILHRALTGGVAWSDSPELRAYVGIFGLALAAIATSLVLGAQGEFSSLAQVIEHSAFQAASLLTTTGYTTRDYTQWPALSQTTLLLLILIGGMAGSTSGGVKVMRVALLGRLAAAQFYRLLHPHAVQVVRLGDKTLEDQVLVSAVGFIGIWFLTLLLGAGVLSILGMELLSSLAAAAAALSNVGPGFADVGPSHTYAPLATATKLVLSTLMILGRLEIYTVLILLTPGFWRR